VCHHVSTIGPICIKCFGMNQLSLSIITYRIDKKKRSINYSRGSIVNQPLPTPTILYSSGMQCVLAKSVYRNVTDAPLTFCTDTSLSPFGVISLAIRRASVCVIRSSDITVQPTGAFVLSVSESINCHYRSLHTSFGRGIVIIDHYVCICM